MGVYKKLKRVFSFKKDKDHKDGQKKDKTAKNAVTTEPAPPNGLLSLERGSSSIDVKTDTLPKETKKRSLSLRSIVRKPSFGKKDKDKKDKDKKDKDKKAKNKEQSGSAPTPVLLSDVITPVSQTPTQQIPQTTTTQTVEYITATVECTTPPPPLPLSSPPTVDSIKDETDSAVQQTAVPDEDARTEEFVVITPADISEIKKYEEELKAEGRSALINEVSAPETKDQTPKETEIEPHTITEVINLLAEKQEPKQTEDVVDYKAAGDAKPLSQSVKVTTDAVPAVPKAPSVTSNGIANGHVNGFAKISETKSTNSTASYKKLDKASRTKVRGLLAALVVVAALVTAALFGSSGGYFAAIRAE